MTTYAEYYGATFPAPGDVLDTAPDYGPTGADNTPTYHAPEASEVLNTAVFGVSSGTSGTVVLPAADKVLDDTSFGPGSSLDGTYHAPDVSEVLDTASFGPASGLVGTYHSPLVAEVLSSVSFGAGSSLTGTVVLPAVSNVLTGVTYGPGSSLTGTLVLNSGTFPPESDVLTGNDYGPTGAEFSGAYVAPSASAVLSSVFFGNAAGTQGTVVLPIAEDVELGVDYGPSLSITGTLLVSSSLTPADIAAIEAALKASVEEFQLPAHSQQQIVTEGDDWLIQLTGLGPLNGRYNFEWAMKFRRSDRTEDAVLFITENEGLVTLHATAASTPSDASLTVTDAAVGNIEIRVKRAVTQTIKHAVYADTARVLATDAVASFRPTGEIRVLPSI